MCSMHRLLCTGYNSISERTCDLYGPYYLLIVSPNALSALRKAAAAASPAAPASAPATPPPAATPAPQPEQPPAPPPPQYPPDDQPL